MKKENFIKKLLEDHGVSAVVFGIVSTIILAPIGLVFLMVRYCIEKPLTWIISKIKNKKKNG